jgi:hypothetical protein
MITVEGRGVKRFINLTPSVPLSVDGEGEKKVRGAGAPLLKQFPPSLHKYSSEGGEGDRFLNPYLGARLRVMFKTKLTDPAYRALTLLILRICDTIEKPCGVVLELG